MVVVKSDDPGEALFRRYLKANGYNVLTYEGDLGTVKRPDFLIRAAGHEVVVEVESFNTPPMPLTPRSGFVNMTAAAEAVCLDVYESVSETAVPLPREVLLMAG
jgi:hypothetical protein